MTIGTYEAKTHFASLLDRVEKGEQVTITRHGVPVAKLVPIGPIKSKEEVRKAIDAIRSLRKGVRLDGLRLRDLIEEGRR